MKTADEILKEQFGHAYGMLHPFEISRITSAMEEYASQFNKPPVYGEIIILDEHDVEQIVKEVISVCKAHADEGCFDYEGAEANAMRIIKRALPPSPGSVGYSSESEKEEHQSIHYWAGRLIGHHQAYDIAEEIIDAITSARLSVKEVSREGEKETKEEKTEIDDVLLKSFPHQGTRFDTINDVIAEIGEFGYRSVTDALKKYASQKSKVLQEENEKLMNFIIELSYLIERIKNG